MKLMTVAFVLLPLATLAAKTTVLSLDPGGYADTEATTNIVLAVDYSRLDRMRFAMELTASATNSLEIAVGTDADGDGLLSLEESDITFGYDCGEWFMRDGDGCAAVENAASDGCLSREVEFRKRAFSPDWNLVRVTRRGIADISEIVSMAEEREHFTLFVR